LTTPPVGGRQPGRALLNDAGSMAGLRCEFSEVLNAGRVRCEMTEPIVELVIVDGRPAIRGECDLANAERIEGWLASFDGHPLEVDLSGVTFFDAAALHALLNARRRNPHTRFVRPSKAVMRVLELTGTVDEAL
jgi:stage II sporulation protein AA (anti-sigma F factor antagonist)